MSDRGEVADTLEVSVRISEKSDIGIQRKEGSSHGVSLSPPQTDYNYSMSS